MPSHGVGPGKTAPKLCYDFLIFDPIKSGNPNTLAKLPPPQGEGQAWKRSPDACNHAYILKESQSVPPPIDLREDGGAKYKVAVICKTCRIHADIYIDTTHSVRTCPTNAHPSHHFQLVSENPEPTRVEYIWQCSIEECGARLRVVYRLQRLQQKEIDSLTSSRLLKQRYDALMRENPGREGVEQATPLKALARLQRYTEDSLGPEQKTLPADNKRFQEAFGLRGQDFFDLLDRLGFKCEVSAWEMLEEMRGN
jgi:ubiquitin carboxyl-terminal hydrolase 25